MNKIKLSIFFIILTISIISITLIKSQKKKLVLPEFVFFDLNNRPFNNKMITSKRVLFVYVSTNCGSCDETLKLIKKLAQKKLDTEFVIVSSSDNLLVSKEKYSYNQLKSKKNINLLYDKNNLFIDAFDLGFVIEYPTLFYYNGSKETLIQIKNLSEDMIL